MSSFMSSKRLALAVDNKPLNLMDCAPAVFSVVPFASNGLRLKFTEDVCCHTKGLAILCDGSVPTQTVFTVVVTDLPKGEHRPVGQNTATLDTTVQIANGVTEVLVKHHELNIIAAFLPRK